MRNIMTMTVTVALALTMLLAVAPVEAATGDLVSSSSNLVVFKLDRDSGYGYWLDSNEANQVVQNKIIPKLQNARPGDYSSYFDSKPTWYTSQYTFKQLIANDLRFHYNYLRWDNDIGYNDWYISRRYWDLSSSQLATYKKLFNEIFCFYLSF